MDTQLRHALQPTVEADIVAAVRRAFESDMLPENVAGALLQGSTMYHSLDRRIVYDDQSSLTIRLARVVRCNDDSATLEFDGDLDVVGTLWTGTEYRNRGRITGPLELVFEDDRWKVTDYRVNGLQMSRCALPSLGGASTNGVRVEVLGGQVSLTAAAMYLELVNEKTTAVDLRHGAIATRRARLPGWRWKRAAVPLKQLEPGSTRAEIGAGLHADATQDFRVFLATSAGRLEVGPPAARRAGVGPWLAWYSIYIWEGIALLAAATVWIPGDNLTAALILLSLGALTLSPPLNRYRTSWPWKLYGAVVAALGLALLAWDKLLT